MTRRHNTVLVLILVATMLASTFQYFAIAVLSSDLIEEFGISRREIGFLAAVNTGGAALLAPYIGRVTDRLGGRLASAAVLAVSGVGLLWTSMATSYWMLLGASLVAGAPQAGSNPATNRVIGQHIPLGQRGLITGWKQSGVQFGIFLAGLTMPSAANAFGWRAPFAVYGMIVLGLAGVARLLLPADLEDEPAPADLPGAKREPLPGIVHRLAVYGLLLGIFSGGVGRFLPLFSEEELGYSATVAGLVAALAGLLGIAGRLAWGVAIERGVDARRALVVIAIGAAATAGMLILAANWSPGLVWLCAAMIAFTSSAWNVVGMLTIIHESPGRATGRASGVVMLGFLGGLTLGAPLMGWVVDATGDYVAGWLVMGVFALAAAWAPGAKRGNRAKAEETISG